MKLTQSVGYAVGILLRIEGEHEAGPLTAARIAKGCRFPPRFLYRVLRRLVSAGILKGVSGPGGGYTLARPSHKILLSEVVAAVEGVARPTPLEPVHRNHKAAMRTINRLVEKSQERFERELARVSLRKLSQARGR